MRKPLDSAALLQELQKAQVEFLGTIDKPETWKELEEFLPKERLEVFKDALIASFSKGFTKGAESSIKLIKQGTSDDPHTVH